MRRRLLLIAPIAVVAVVALVVVGVLAARGGSEEHGLIAYSVVREEVPTRIIVVQDDGKKARRVSGARFRANPVLPKWSPDGGRIAFVRANPAGGPRAFQIYVVNEDGSNERQLGQGTLPVWTNDGRFVVVERLGSPPEPSTIQVLAADGSGARRLTVGSAPTVSHRGSQVAFVRYTFGRRPNGDLFTTASSLWTINLDGTGLRRLGRTTARNVQWAQPSWVPDDSAVAVVQRSAGVVGGPLLTFSMNGSRRVVVPRVGETYDWSNVGDRIAYTLGDSIYIVRSDGTEEDVYGRSSAIDIEWSPDGTKVAFSVSEAQQTGQFIGLYTIDEEKKERRRFAIADGFAAFLDWKPEPEEPD
jgi:Tol biopolymer transport system component